MGRNSFNDMLHLHYEVNWINQISSFAFKSADFYLFIFFNIQSKNSLREFRFLWFLSSSESRGQWDFIALPTTEFACSTKGQSDGSVDRNIYLRIRKAWFQPPEPRMEGKKKTWFLKLSSYFLVCCMWSMHSVFYLTNHIYTLTIIANFKSWVEKIK